MIEEVEQQEWQLWEHRDDHTIRYAVRPLVDPLGGEGYQFARPDNHVYLGWSPKADWEEVYQLVPQEENDSAKEPDGEGQSNAG